MHIKRVGIISAIAISIACTARTGPRKTETVLNRAGLEARVFSLYEAEQQEDWRRCFQMMALAHTGEFSYKEFLEELESSTRIAESYDDPRFLGNPKILLFRISKVEPKMPDGDFGLAEAAASVRMYLVVEYPAGPIERIKDQTDYWVYLDGAWYWTWRGWPDD